MSERQSQVTSELTDTRLLHRISVEIIHEENVGALYEKIVDAAVDIMRSDYASMQMLYPERGKSGSGGELRLLAFRGFNPEAAKFWEWVSANSQCVCGQALRTGQRVVASDVTKSDYLAGTEHLTTYLQTGIRAVQSTPLRSRSGRVVGMISTHWKEPHEPSQRDLRLLDILARQAADLIERHRGEERERSLMKGSLAATAKFEAVFNQSGIFAGIMDLAGNLVEINDRCELVRIH